MKRVILTAPEGVTLEALTAEQRAGVDAVFGQFCLPMPGTIPFGGSVLIDAVTKDNFDPVAIGELGLPFGLMGLWQWDGVSPAVTEIVPLGETFISFLPDRITDDGTPLPPILMFPHAWAGWPAIEV